MNMLPEVVLFDDDESNLRILSTSLCDQFKMNGFQNPYLFEEAIRPNISAVLIDLLMPLMDGLELFHKIKTHQNYNGCPIFFISGSASHELKLRSIQIGGSDFLSKTMNKDEITERIKNKINSFKTTQTVFILGGVKIDLSNLKTFFNKQPVDLTITEMKIMKILIRDFSRTISREEINESLWPGMKVLPTTLNTHLSNLRNKFSNWEYEIQFIKSKGVELKLKSSCITNTSDA